MLPYSGRCSHHICMGATAFLKGHREAASIRKVFLPLVLDDSAPRIRAVVCSTPDTAVDYVETFIEGNRIGIEQRRDAILAGRAKDPYS
jgi:hypothetical protein